MLYCDSPYATYLDQIGMLGVFDAVDTVAIDAADSLDLSPRTFWSLGRLLALRAATVPFVSLDCDLIVWRDLTDTLGSSSICVTHWESTDASPWYPGLGELSTPPDYQWQPWMRVAVPAANVSLLYIRDREIRDAYVNEALRFAIANPARPRPDLGLAPELLFAEQCLLPLVARQSGIDVVPLIDAVWLPTADRFATHDPRFGEWDPLRIKGQAGLLHGLVTRSVTQPEWLAWS